MKPERPIVRLGLLALLGLGPLLACDQAMARQPKRKPLESSLFFSDGQSSRPPVPGTLAQGDLELDRHLFQGTQGAQPASTFPFVLTREVLERGRERYDIFCSPCHDRTGSGQGRVVQRGYRAPPSYHLDRLRQLPVGRLFQIITQGQGAMPDYEDQIPARDRWAIVAYIRALQESRIARAQDVPAEELKILEGRTP